MDQLDKYQQLGKLNFITKMKYDIERKTKWMKNQEGFGRPSVAKLIFHLWEISQERSPNVLLSFNLL